MKQFFLLILVILIGGTVLRLYGKHSAPAATILTAAEAKARLDSGDPIVLLDVRTQEEFDQGHIPGAVCLPNESITADMPVAFDKDAEILVYCRSGRRSAEAAKKLAGMGYANVRDFGGIIDWPYETTMD